MRAALRGAPNKERVGRGWPAAAAVFARVALLVAFLLATGMPTFSQSLSVPQKRDSDPPPPSSQTETPQTEPSADEPESPASLLKPLQPQEQAALYVPITPRQRLRWFVRYTFGPSHLVGGAVVAGVTTGLDRPPEYGTHWDGFGSRYGLRMTGIVPQNAMEAGLGYELGEDPRYFSARDLPLKARITNVIRMTFVARRTDGSYGLAYARYAAISGTNFLSNTWRPRSEANTQGALIRIGAGFAGRMAVNAFEEFWPSVRDHFFSRN